MSLFGKLTEKKVEQLKQAVSLKTDQEIIDQIHSEFDNAQENLLKEAKLILAQYAVDIVELEKSVASRLQKFGFRNTPLAKKSQEQQGKINKNKRQAEVIEYYQQTYPFIKFLTEEALDTICKKYGLIYTTTDKYIKEVPEKNLKELETCQKLKAADNYNAHLAERLEQYAIEDHQAISDMNDSSLKSTPRGGYHNRSMRYDYQREFERDPKCSGLFIAAPKSHFNLEGMVKDGEFGYKNEVKDPIVFRYVRGGIQVLTKWGLEASDPALVLGINN